MIIFATLTGLTILELLALLLAALVVGLMLRRTRAGGHVLAWALGVLIGFDVTANAVAGGRAYSTISCRIGESIERGGWAARVRWPAWWVAHCKAAVYTATV